MISEVPSDVGLLPQYRQGAFHTSPVSRSMKKKLRARENFRYTRRRSGGPLAYWRASAETSGANGCCISQEMLGHMQKVQSR